MYLENCSRWFISIVVCLVLFTNAAAANDKYMLMTEDWPPLNYLENGELKGPSIEIVQAILDRLKIENKIKVLPFKRAYQNVSRHPNAILFSVTRTKEREALFKWVGPLSVKRYAFYAKKPFKEKLHSMDDVSQYRVGVQLGGVTEQALISEGFPLLDGVVKPQQNLQRLMLNRIDLWYDTNATVSVIARDLGVDTNALEEAYVVGEAELYIAFNKDASDHDVFAWQTMLNELYKDGTVKEIYNRYQLGPLIPNFIPIE